MRPIINQNITCCQGILAYPDKYSAADPQLSKYWALVRPDDTQACSNEAIEERHWLYSIPDLTLDWMHECAASLIDEDYAAYRDTLELICMHDWIAGKTRWPFPVDATALQRAEAYLRVKGLWKDEVKL